MSDPVGESFSEFSRLCSLNLALSRRLKKATGAECKAIEAEMEANRAKMRAGGKRAAPCLVKRKRDAVHEAEEAEREARRREEGYW